MNAVRILAIISVLIAVFIVLDASGVFRSLFTASETSISGKIEEDHPEGDIDIDFQENCTICDEFECRVYPGPCWKITVIEDENGTKVVTEMVMDPAGNVIEETSRPCTEWWCDADECRYTFTQQVDGLQAEVTNSDCQENLICDPEYERCRTCQSGDECIMKTVKTGSTSTHYRFEVMGTGEYADIDDVDLICRVNSRGAVIHEQPLSVQECGDLMYDHTRCSASSCDYTPEYALLPP